MKNSPLKIHLEFWLRHPALGIGISALLGIMNLWLGLGWLALQIALSPSKAWVHALFLAIFALYAQMITSSLPDTMQDRFLFRTHSLQRSSSPFRTDGWLYKGTILGSLPCSVVYHGKGPRPKADRDYFLTGVLERRDHYNYTLKASSWEPVPKSWSLAELRFSIREELRSLLKRHLAHDSASFLVALFTGDKESRSITYDFSRLGLQHILAISGFHFAMIVAFVTFAARQLLSTNKRVWFLLFAGLLYFLFVGDSPPVFRSFCTLSLFLGGKILQRYSSGLNLLGASLFIELLLNPLVCYSIGFQLSFLSCLAILLFHNPIQKSLETFLPSRSFSELKELSHPSQCGAILIALFKKSLTIMLAVNLALWPLLLFHFHRFPLLSLIYNLFVPEVAALSLCLLLISLVVYALAPILSLPIFKITDVVAGSLLELTANPPVLLDFQFCIALPGWITLFYLIALILFGVHLKATNQNSTFQRI
jgi:competence protein ComEC